MHYWRIDNEEIPKKAIAKLLDPQKTKAKSAYPNLIKNFNPLKRAQQQLEDIIEETQSNLSTPLLPRQQTQDLEEEVEQKEKV